MKTIPVKWCVNGIPGAPDTDPNGLLEVTKTGTGFFLVKRHVFEKLKTHPAVKPFANDIGLDKSLDENMKTYFDTAVRENRYYSEDWTFCENWRDIGGKVFVDKRVLLKHVGTYVFDFATQDQLYKDLQALAQQNGAVAPVDSTATVSAVGGDAAVGEMIPATITEIPEPTPPKTRVLSSKKGRTAKDTAVDAVVEETPTAV
jgi:hypothetical protein